MGEYLNAVLRRRSMYSLSQKSNLADAALEEKLAAIVKNMPTSYNMQSSHLVLLLGQANQKLWQGIVMETLRAQVPEDKFPRTEKKINGFAESYGTVMFFNDEDVADGVRAAFPKYAENVEPWILQQQGMLQFAVWAFLEDEGFGASLQHYNPIIDDEVKETWGLPKGWRLFAQMPFGVPTAPADEKKFKDVQKQFQTFR